MASLLFKPHSQFEEFNNYTYCRQHCIVYSFLWQLQAVKYFPDDAVLIRLHSQRPLQAPNSFLLLCGESEAQIRVFIEPLKELLCRCQRVFSFQSWNSECIQETLAEKYCWTINTVAQLCMCLIHATYSFLALVTLLPSRLPALILS